jgi:hypothetical protein
MNVTKNLGMLVLAVFLILQGLVWLLNLAFSGQAVVMGALAIAAGVPILLGK